MNLKIFTILLFFTAGMLYAQPKTLERTYTPIVATSAEAPLAGLEYEKWSAWSWNDDSRSWVPVAFQVDEVDDNGKYNKAEEIDGKIDGNDEMVVMPQDLGARAPFGNWVSDTGLYRIELAFTDPLEPDKTGWIYLFQTTENAGVTGYFSDATVPAEAPAADTVHSRYYDLGFSNTGWLNFMAFPRAPKINLVDRLKLRLSGDPVLPSMPDFVITEDDLAAKLDSPDGPVSFRKHHVRSFHDRRTWLTLPIGGPPVTADYQLQYFPYSMYIGLEDFGVDAGFMALFGLQAMRQSLDLTGNASDMTFYSAQNTGGLPIDGNIDTFTAELDTGLTAQWMMASGDAGTIVLVLGVLQVDNSVTELYYHDNAGEATLDETPDTGDMQSWSDMGLWIKSTGAALKTASLTMTFNAYFIDKPNLNAEFGQQLMDRMLNPLNLTAEQQDYVESRVVSAQSGPQNYALHPAYPNPFRHAMGHVHIEFETVHKNEIFDAVIFNLLGQKVAAIPGIKAQNGRNRITWDGHDMNGQPVPAGVYYFKLYNKNVSLYNKMIVLDAF